MSSDEIIIEVANLCKRYEIYASPRDRLKQLVLPAFYNLFYRFRYRLGQKIDTKLPQYFREFWALHDVSFKVYRGETFGIIGLNGSGKSTLLQMICSTLTPTSGNVRVKGRVAALLELGSGFNPEFTGRENIYLNGQILGLSREDVELKFDTIVSFANIGDFIDQPVKTYSSGMVVRLAFAVAVHVDPEILVVDEALAVGDMPFQIKCFAHLRKLRESGTSILFVSHDISTVRTFCDRAIYLDHGKMVAIGFANEICKQYEINSIKGRFTSSDNLEKAVESQEVTPIIKNQFISNEVLVLLENYRNIFLHKKHEGSQSVIAESFILVDKEVMIVESIEPKQSVTAYVLVRLNKRLHHDFHFSIQIYNKQGFPIMVMRDSIFEEQISGDVNDRFVLSMTVTLPLQAGEYFCQIALLLFPPGEKYEHGQFNFESAEVADMVDHATYLRILPYHRHFIPVPLLNEAKLTLIPLKQDSS